MPPGTIPKGADMLDLLISAAARTLVALLLIGLCVRCACIVVAG